MGNFRTLNSICELLFLVSDLDMIQILVVPACYISCSKSKTVLQLWCTNPQGIFHHPQTLEIDPRALNKPLILTESL